MFLLRVRADLLWRFVVGVVWFVPCQFKVTVCIVVFGDLSLELERDVDWGLIKCFLVRLV
jgi:hypothetical protein